MRQAPPAQRALGAELTPRELEVLEMMAAGLINKQIAKRLGLRLNTVRNHSQNILYKLRAHSRLEAVATAVRDGIIGYPLQTFVDGLSVGWMSAVRSRTHVDSAAGLSGPQMR